MGFSVLKKTIEVLRGIRRLPDHVTHLGRRLDHLERNVMVAPLSPIDRHIALQTAFRSDALYDLTYAHWRTTRIAKLIELYGLDNLPRLKILELGAGLCEIGAFLAELGADVTCLEGRPEQVSFARLKHRSVPRLRIEQCDLEGEFSHYGRFDLILHFGLLYHIGEVDEHMARCFAMTDDMVLETVVCDSTDPYKLVKVPGRAEVIEESIHGYACRPSAAYVERLAEQAGFSVERHFSKDLNASDGQFVYDWEPKNDGDLGDFRKRRFWRFKRKP
ncbi:methyltransferase [Mesorhizobium sp. WSM3859]|uniref:class I SAM-dependent methyltransferase n=1 Tax=Mesorhizobium sp. WSM3859 TaxID=2029402 RepID=UPI000BAEC028|nr:methyltransferase [Mesorhizobium sp. WSM3859]